MLVLNKTEALKVVPFLSKLSGEELTRLGGLCHEGTFQPGELCQKVGEPPQKVNFIIKGKIGVEFHIPNIAYGSKDIVMYTLEKGEVFGWTALIQGVPWSTLRAIEPTEVLSINADDLINLCESENHIGYIIMKGLASLIASRLRRTRMSMLNSMVAIKGEW
jgi:CRP-like cAMP-binding protein